jgi:hypothetical protein
MLGVQPHQVLIQFLQNNAAIGRLKTINSSVIPKFQISNLKSQRVRSPSGVLAMRVQSLFALLTNN